MGLLFVADQPVLCNNSEGPRSQSFSLSCQYVLTIFDPGTLLEVKCWPAVSEVLQLARSVQIVPLKLCVCHITCQNFCYSGRYQLPTMAQILINCKYSDSHSLLYYPISGTKLKPHIRNGFLNFCQAKVSRQAGTLKSKPLCHAPIGLNLCCCGLF